MSLKVESVILGPETDQYAGRGQDAQSLTSIAEAGRRAERLGFDVVNTPEAGHDAFLPLAIVAEHTSGIQMGTNVAVAFPRSPMATAQVAWDLQHLSGGRFQLGLGTQVKGHIERRYATPWTGAPGPRLREYILCMQAMFQSFQNPAEPSYFEGEHYRYTMMSPFFNPGPIENPDIPIYIAAVNTYNAKLCGELCAGLRAHPVATFAYSRDVLAPAIEAGARKSGRSLEEIDIVGSPFLAVAADEAGVDKARQALKQHIAFYASTRSYHAVLEYHGWQDLGAKLHQLSVQGKWTELPQQITDDMLAEWAIVGTYDELPAKLKASAQGAYNSVLLDLPRALMQDEDRVADIVRQLQE
ncbi:MAG: TIGR03617 family F420-dependent LLM class oxidoreductase [Halieaceae bacterium]|nr:TIGR03617 family F420-dependent LLM class oxidoreductase [Halieaceae bacterium]